MLSLGTAVTGSDSDSWAGPGADRAEAPHSRPTVHFLPPLR